MLNLFPLQFLAPLAYTLLRLSAGLILLRLGALRVRHRKESREGMPVSGSVSLFLFWTGLLEMCAGLLFLAGAYTQVAAMIATALVSLQLLLPGQFGKNFFSQRMFLVLLLFVSISLFITGAGAFGFDLPI